MCTKSSFKMRGDYLYLKSCICQKLHLITFSLRSLRFIKIFIMKKCLYAFFAIFLIMLLSTSCKNKPIRLFAGTYTETGHKGLYIFDLRPEAGSFKLLSEAVSYTHLR